MWHPENCAGFSQQLGKMLRSAPSTPVITEQVSTQDLMLTLVAAGYGVGFSTMAHFEVSQHKDVVTRHLAGQQCMLTTYFLQHGSEPSEQLTRFIRRASPGSR